MLRFGSFSANSRALPCSTFSPGFFTLVIQQLGIGPDYHASGAEPAALAQCAEQALVFGLVVGAGADEPADLSNDGPVRSADADSDSGRAGISKR